MRKRVLPEYYAVAVAGPVRRIEPDVRAQVLRFFHLQ